MDWKLSELPQMLEGLRVGVLTGGRSRERDRSLLSGSAVAEALAAMGVRAEVIDTAQPGMLAALTEVDVAFLAIAGRYSEDGTLQGLLDSLGILYTGSGVLASAVGMHKPWAKTVVAAAGVEVLAHEYVDPAASGDPASIAETVVERLGGQVIVKPAAEGGSVGVAVAHDAAELAALLRDNATDGLGLLIEPFIQGTAVTVGVLDTSDGPVALPILAVEAATEFYDFTSKRDDSLHTYQCPAPLPASVAEEVTRAALLAHGALGCRGHSRSDFVIDPDGRAWWLEVNTLPGLSRTGNLATMADAAGISYPELIGHILAGALTPSAGRR